MLQNPFGDPFSPGSGPSMSDIFRRRGGAVRAPKKPEAAGEPEPEPETDPESGVEDTAGTESPKEKVILKNPRWEIEAVGFNEETDIAVDVELPEEHAHKTRVDFEIFTAKHSQSDLLKDESKTKEVEELADPLLESHILQDVTFATGKSFPSPAKADALDALVTAIGEWKTKH